MNLVLAEATSLEKWGKLVQDYGLGVILAGFVATVLFFLVRKMISGHERNMTYMKSLVDARDTTIDNHLDHVHGSLNELAVAVKESATAQSATMDRLIEAQREDHRTQREMVDKLAGEQRHQTEMVREILDSKLDKLDRKNSA